MIYNNRAGDGVTITSPAFNVSRETMTMNVRYKYDDVDEFVKDRSFETHRALKAALNDDFRFGQILRNVMKHAFECGVTHAGGKINDDKYE
jgi:hypothetical protein